MGAWMGSLSTGHIYCIKSASNLALHAFACDLSKRFPKHPCNSWIMITNGTECSLVPAKHSFCNQGHGRSEGH